MSFLDRARQAAEQAADQARQKAEQASARIHDPAAQEDARTALSEAVGQARRGIATVIEKIDPSVLADVIIKATALQEKANISLRQKGSAYRISEVTITATIPPQVGFAIARLGDIEELRPADAIDSAALVETAAVPDAAVLALDGSTTPVEAVDRATGGG